MQELALLDSSLPISNLDAYITQANRLPMLTEAEEKAFATQLHTNNDHNAARKLIMPHLRYVVRVARGYQGYGLPLGDLIQEGNIGLMKAVKRFNPDMGVRLVSFAVHWIKAEIHEFILKNWRIVKVATTKAQRKLFFKLRSAKSRLGWFTNDEVNAVAKDLNVKPEAVRLMEERLNARDAAFDGFATSDDSDDFIRHAPADYLASETAGPAALYESNTHNTATMESLQTAMMNLDERSRDILTARWLQDKKSTLHDLAEKYGVSAERIRQIEKLAMSKVKTKMAS